MVGDAISPAFLLLASPPFAIISSSALCWFLLDSRWGLYQPVAWTRKYLTLLKALTKGSNFSRMDMSRKSKPPLARTALMYAAVKNRSYVRCSVLPSMKKATVYKCRICMGTDAIVKVALCTCTAGLGDVCNHIAALLYALEEFVRLGLREDDTSPTSQLCKWNRPRPRRVAPCAVSEVQLSRAKFGAKRTSVKRKAFYNPIPPNKHILNPAELKGLQSDLRKAHEAALCVDKAGMGAKYGSSTLLTALESSSDTIVKAVTLRKDVPPVMMSWRRVLIYCTLYKQAICHLNIFIAIPMNFMSIV